MKLRPFELGLAIFFGGLAFLALFILSTYKGEEDKIKEELNQIGQVTVWGTLPSEGINSYFSEQTSKDPLSIFKQIFYRFIPEDRFSAELISALADRRGPDIILIPHEKLAELRSRIVPIPEQSFPQRDFRNLYLDGMQIFNLSDGLYSYPVAVDPLVMYWNRDILSTKGFLEAPRTWEVLINTMFPELIERDFDRTIKRSVLAMGEYGNVRNAFAIISALLIQSGTRGVTDTDGMYRVQLNTANSGGGNPLQTTAEFYTRFSRASNNLYSWNRSLPQDRQQFIAGDLVFYFGFGSEARELEKLNPNLKFDIVEIPQGETATVRRTYGKMYGLSILKSANNLAGAYAVIPSLSGVETANQIAIRSNLVPAFRTTVAAGSNDVYGRILYQTAPVVFGWLNPDPKATDVILETMVKDINENRRDVSGASGDVVSKLVREY